MYSVTEFLYLKQEPRKHSLKNNGPSILEPAI